MYPKKSLMAAIITAVPFVDPGHTPTTYSDNKVKTQYAMERAANHSAAQHRSMPIELA